MPQAKLKIKKAEQATLCSLPRMGVGLGYRAEIARDIMEHVDEIEVLEVLADRIFRGSERAWEETRDLAKIFTLIPHGVNLSIGSVDCLEDESYLKALDKLSRWIPFPYYSDHFAFTKTKTRAIGHLAPLWLTHQQLDTVVQNILAIQNRIQKPLILETITIPFELPEAEMKQEDFFNAAVEASGCGLLLDLANVFINGINHGFEPLRFLEKLNLDAVVQIHLAGGVQKNGFWIDSHSASIHPEVWKLLRTILPQCQNLKAIIVERDSEFIDFSELLNEVRQAREIWTRLV